MKDINAPKESRNTKRSSSYSKDPKRPQKRNSDEREGNKEKRCRPILIDLTAEEMPDSTKEAKSDLKAQPLNPMIFYTRFSHITEQIFAHLDKKSLSNCREVAKSWQESIDNRNILWLAVVNKIGAEEAFQLACKSGHSKMV